jgi:hypothetical protein
VLTAQRYGSAAAAGLARRLLNYRAISSKTRLCASGGAAVRWSRCWAACHRKFLGAYKIIALQFLGVSPIQFAFRLYSLLMP